MGTRGITVPLHGEWGRAFQTVWQCVGSWCTGGGDCDQGGSGPIAKNCGKKLRKIAVPQPNPPQPQGATLLHRWLRMFLCLQTKNCGKNAENCKNFRKNTENCENAQNCEKLRTAIPPPPSWCPCTHGLWRIVWRTASRAASCQDQGKQPVQGLHEKAGHAVLLAC